MDGCCRLLQLPLVYFALVLVLADLVGNSFDEDVLLLVEDVLHLKLVFFLELKELIGQVLYFLIFFSKFVHDLSLLHPPFLSQQLKLLPFRKQSTIGLVVFYL